MAQDLKLGSMSDFIQLLTVLTKFGEIVNYPYIQVKYLENHQHGVRGYFIYEHIQAETRVFFGAIGPDAYYTRP